MAEPLCAYSLSIASCPHGSIYLRLHDEAGEVFALATFGPEVAVDLIDDLVGTTEEVLKALGLPVAGRA